MAPALFRDLGKRAEKLFELPVKAGLHSQATWHAEQERNGKIVLGYESLENISGGGKPKGLLIQWMADDDPSGLKFVELRPGGRHKMRAGILYNDDCSFDIDVEDSDEEGRHVARVGCKFETDSYALAADIDLLDEDGVGMVSAVTSLSKNYFAGFSLHVNELSPEPQVGIELACGSANPSAWWKCQISTDAALAFSGMQLEAIQSFKIRSKRYLHDACVGGRVSVEDQKTFTCEYAGRMKVDDLTVACAKCGVDTLGRSPVLTASVTYSYSPTIKIGALVGGTLAGFSNLGLSLNLDFAP